MSGQLALEGTGVAVPPEVRLGANQRLVLELLEQRPRSSEELGVAVHERRHGVVGHRCRFCKDEGAAIGASLRRHGLVRFSRKMGVWYLLEQGPPRIDRGAQTDAIPF